jgi:hypothetical protein
LAYVSRSCAPPGSPKCQGAENDRRKLTLDQNVLSAKNLSIFF